MTLTLATLYEKQGLIGKAREIYTQIAAGHDPVQAAEARRRLSSLPSAKARIAALEELLRRVQAAGRRT